ncbi:hypothetical protein CLV70_10776 [Pseudosporangium ferrugineum]|uniref:Uncharacterized protein n=1 Tax=Pseudosporangium ferrugineum TaxID=439699 RepID=A0A2T0S674_9ACTN|nr:hypothetical protein CLV70_10776 [Pseudosporangium ferrugineum]
MAAVNSPGYPAPAPPPAPERRKPRWVLVAVVAAWALVLAAVAVWSVRHDPPTVPEQRDIADALPVLREAAGAVVLAADGPDRVIEIGAPAFDRECGLTPVRGGVEATQEVTVRVRADQAPAVLDSIARGLPKAYAPAIRHNAGNTRHALRADAGDFVGVDATVSDDSTSFALRVSTGCRPFASGLDLDPAPRPAGEPPAAFSAALRAIGAQAAPTVVEVACPNGRTAATVTAADLKAPADLGRSLRDVVAGALVVQAEPHAWAYRAGEVSVVVGDGGGSARLSATTSCR